MAESGFTDNKVHEWLQQIADGAWVSLHFDSPVLGGVGMNEISGGGYNRVKVPFSQPSNRTIWSLADVTFTGLAQTTLTHFGLWDASTQGELMAYAALPEKVAIYNGWGYTLHEGDLALSVG